MDPNTLEREYSPSSMVGGDLTPFLRRYERECAAVYARHEHETVRYGSSPTNTLDLFPAADASSLHIYVHGGYWQQLSKNESVFPAPSFLAEGESFAAIDYTLAPEATIDDMVVECTAALQTLIDRGWDPSAITLSGWSAGAQLVVMTTLGMKPDLRPGRLVLVSGIFELEPLVATYVNEPLGLDVVSARRLSPLGASARELPPTSLVWGEHDTDEFKRQSRAMADHIRAAGVQTAETEIADRNHFDVIFELSPAL